MHPGISFRQLQVFVAVTRAGTVGAAARGLSLSQSATSQSLADLEKHLGVPLFERVGKRLQLNELGSRLLPKAEHLLHDLNAFVDAAREPDGELQGTLTVAASATIGTYLLPELAGRFSEQHPAVDLQVRLRNTGEVIADLLRLEADLGLIEGQCCDPKLKSEFWRHDEMVVVCNPAHPSRREVGCLTRTFRWRTGSSVSPAPVRERCSRRPSARSLNASGCEWS